MLAAIVDTGSLSKAADRLGKSQPSLSRTLAELEARLGAELFEKARRPLRPTELGKVLSQEGRAIAKSAEAASLAVQNHKSGQLGALRLGGTPVFIDGAVSQMVASFQTAYPDVRVDQSYGYFGDLVRELTQNQIDIALCPLARVGLPDGLMFRTLLPGRNVIACRAGHPLTRRSALKLDDIAPYPWIAAPAESPLFQDLRQVLTEIGITDIRVSFSGGSLASMVNVLVGSDALTIVPHSVLYMQRHAYQVTALPIRISHPQRHLGMLWKKSGGKPATQRLTRYVAAQFDALQNSMQGFERQMVWKT